MDQILAITKIVLCVATALTGLFAFVFPQRVKGFTGLDMPGPRGVSEVRAILGGLLIGLGVAPLILAAPETYRMLGLGYGVIAVTRLFSIIFDKSYEGSNLISLAIEIVFAVLLWL